MNRALYAFSVLSATMVAIGVTWVVSRTAHEPLAVSDVPAASQTVTPTSIDAEALPSDAVAPIWYDDTQVEVRDSAYTYSWMKSETGIRCVWYVDRLQILTGSAMKETAAQKIREHIQSMKDRLEDIDTSNQEQAYVNLCEDRADGVENYEEELSTEMEVVFNRLPYLAVVGTQTEHLSIASQQFVWVDARLFDTRTGDPISLDALISTSSVMDFRQRLAKAMVNEHAHHLFDPGEMSWYPSYTKANIGRLQQFARASKTEAAAQLKNEDFGFFSQIPFALTDEGVVIYFSQESVAPYQQGVVKFLYPYVEWADLMKPEVSTALLTNASR